MFKKSIILIVLVIIAVYAEASVFYVAVDGNDLHSGSIDQPLATIQKSQSLAKAGDTVYVRGGTYLMTESQIARQERIWAYVTDLNKSGKPGAPIHYWAYPNEHPVFDYSQIKPQNLRVIAFNVTGSWLHIKGLEIVGVQVTIKTHTQSECFENKGSHNVYEQLSMHDGMAIGFYLLDGSDNLVLNCDAYNNYDPVSEIGRGGNTDGFGCHPTKGAVNNVFRGCRAWFNSDDGYDVISSHEAVVFDHCWAFYNGFSTDFKSLGDGNGFKGGGYGGRTVDQLPVPIPRHVIRNCLAVGNKVNGFYSNHHIGGSDWIHNSAYRNATNFNMLCRLGDNKTDVPGYGHLLQQNLGFKGRAELQQIDSAQCKLINNYFQSAERLTESDFISLDEKLLVAPRNTDGSLPENGFMKLKPNSKWKGMGMESDGQAQANRIIENNGLKGNLQVHDPVMIKQGNVYYVFGTGLSIKTSKDRINWINAGSVFGRDSIKFAWWYQNIPDKPGLWAPDIHYANGKYHLYYSVSAWMNFNSAIGYATNTTLDKKDPAYHWIDQGEVISFRNGGNGVNVIDPNIFIDKDGSEWLVYGSYKAGLRLVPINPVTGKLFSEKPDMTILTTSLGEGAFLIRDKNYYYLFASRGRCCAGNESTYQIVVGRAKNIKGPYLNKNGASFLDNQYSVFLAGDSTEPGRGHNGFYSEQDTTFIVYHAYTRSQNGASLLNIRPMYLDEEGWPTLQPSKQLFRREEY